MAEGNSEGYAIKFTADLSDLRRQLEQFNREVAEGKITVGMTAAGAGGGGGGGGASSVTPAGRITSLLGTDPAAMVQEDARRAERLAGAAASGMRLERAAASSTAFDWTQYFGAAGQDFSTGPAAAVARAIGATSRVVAPPAPRYSGRFDEPDRPYVAPPALRSSGRFDAPTPRIVAPPALRSSGRFDEPEAEPSGSPWQNINRMSVGRMFGVGMAAHELLNAGIATQRYGAASLVAGNDQAAQYDATMAYRRDLLSLPFVGQAIGYAADPNGTAQGELDLIRGSVDVADRKMALARHASEFHAAQGDLTSIALARGSYAKHVAASAAEYRLDRERTDKEANGLSAGYAEEYQATLKGARATFARTSEEIDSDERAGGSAGGSASKREAKDALAERRKAAEDRMNSDIAAAGANYQAKLEQDRQRFDKDREDAKSRQQERDRNATVSRTATLGYLGVDTRAAQARLRGDPDAAAMIELTGRGEVVATAEQDTDVAAATRKSTAAAADVLKVAATRAGAVRRIGFASMTAADMARARGDEFAAGLYGVVGAGAAGVVGNERASDFNAVLSQGVAGLAGYLGTTARQLSWQSQDVTGSTAQNNLMAQGDTFGAQRQGVQTRLNAALRVLPDNPLFNYLGAGALRDDLRANAKSENDVIDRNQNLYHGGLNTALNVSSAQAMGSEYGGYQETAGVRQLIGDIKQRWAAAGTSQDRSTIGNTGLNLLTATQRDIRMSGNVTEEASGTLGAGFGGSGDQSEAEKELTEAIKALTERMWQNFLGADTASDDLDNY